MRYIASFIKKCSIFGGDENNYTAVTASPPQ